jgi:hypothetical protein
LFPEFGKGNIFPKPLYLSTTLLGSTF